MIRQGIFLVLCVAAAFAAAQAQQSGYYEVFPFSRCANVPSAYSLRPIWEAFGNGTFCFTLDVKVPADTTGFCLTQADLRKIEINVNPDCDIKGTLAKSTLNGLPTTVNAAFFNPKLGPPGSTLLRMTQLGLGLSDNGAKICITLTSKLPGNGCTSLATMCEPPEGISPGVCSVAFFDTELKCCSIGTSSPPSRTSPLPLLTSSSPPPPPPAPSSRPPRSPHSPPPPPPPSPSPPSPPPSPSPPSPLRLTPPTSPPPSSPPSPPLPASPNPSPSPLSRQPPRRPFATRRPPSPPPPSQLVPCKVCSYLILKTVGSVIIPIYITEEQCNGFADRVVNDLQTLATEHGSVLLATPPEVTCSTTQAKVCVYFRSEEDGAVLQPYIQDLAQTWQQLVLGKSCPAYLEGYAVSLLVDVDDDGSTAPAATDISPGRLSAYAEKPCPRSLLPFPKCVCNISTFATPFMAQPFIYKAPGRKSSLVLYCFMTTVVDPIDPETSCGRSDTLLKVEFWADDNQRRAIRAIGTQPSGASAMKMRFPTWGGRTDQTLKAAALNWTKKQAQGGQICLELTKDADIDTFCLYGQETCWLNLFSPDRQCCPLLPATVIEPPPEWEPPSIFI